MQRSSRDLDLPVGCRDGRRLGVVAHGLPLFNGTQIAIHTTLVSPIRGDGQPRPCCARHDGEALAVAGGKRGGPIQNSRVSMDVHDLWFSPRRWAVDGQPNHVVSSTSWRRPKHVRFPRSCRAEKRVAEFDAQRALELASLEEGSSLAVVVPPLPNQEARLPPGWNWPYPDPCVRLLPRYVAVWL